MTSKELYKNFYANYKRLEKYFFRADKSGDRIAYFKLKQQFRIMLIFSALGTFGAILLIFKQGFFVPSMGIFMILVLIGFRFKFHNSLRAMAFIVLTIIPIRHHNGPALLVTPVTIMFMNSQVLIQTQSQYLMIIHFVIQYLALNYYGFDNYSETLQRMTPKELAESTQAALNNCIICTVANLITMQKFYSHLAKLLRKVGSLKDSLSEINSQLNDQNLKLQNNLELKDVFIYTFSHELKNALNGLLGNLTLAYDTAKDSQILQFLASAKVCGEVLKNFVHNILDSGKLENGNLEVSPERKDVMSFMENIWTICRRLIQNKRLQGFLVIEKTIPRYLDLDEQRMIQIILNLVSNACKFTEKGYVRIHVSWQVVSASSIQHIPAEHRAGEAENNHSEVVGQQVNEPEYFSDVKEFSEALEGSSLNKEKLHLVTERQKKFITNPQFYQLDLAKCHWNHEKALPSGLPEGSKGILKIQVVDTGCGITPEGQAMLFQKFSQVNHAAGQRKVGTGLGLWICKELANRLGGDIKVRSTLGKGSVFELSVQTIVSHLKEKLFINQVSTDVAPRYSLHQGVPNTRKILIADDDDFNVELMKNYLNKFEINYLCAHDGEEAVSLFKKHHKEICFIITDNFMPKKTGIEAALEIKSFLEEIGRPKIHILCVSGDVKVNVGGGGFTSVIQKPINFDRLKEELAVVYPQISY